MTDQIPLSFNQEFLCVLDEGDITGAFSNRHTLVNGWRLTGKVDVEALHGALDDIVARHEILRTTIIRDAEPRYQEICPPSPVTLLVTDLPPVADKSRNLRTEELLNEVERDTLSVRGLPLLRAVLGRFDDHDSILILVLHHIAADAWSVQLIIRDLATCYAIRRGYRPRGLPDVHQYREFAVSQRTSSADEETQVAREYWREKLRGAQVFAIPTDQAPPAELASPYSKHNFLIDAELTEMTVEFAKEMRSSPFIILLAAFYLLSHKMTGATDLTVQTFTSGRNEPRFRNTVGPFLNLLPIRTDIASCASFRDVVARTRASCVDAYAHDVSFAHILPVAHDLMQPSGKADLALFAFEMVQSPGLAEGTQVGDISYSEIRKRLLPQPVASGIPNGVLWALDLLPSGETAGSVQFNPDQFDRHWVVDMVREYRRVLRKSVTEPDERRELP